MGEQFLLIEYISSVNSIIRTIFQKGHRVKLTSFDVSTKFLVFGASTGGIYIFTREPCQFLKLIPSTYGSAVLVAISENEENLAVATSTGSAVVLENCFNDSNYQQQVFSEHYGQIITAIKWNNFDLYCGDNSGKVSVITTKNFIAKSIFQPPIACLMHLESPVIQIDTYSKLLLVSTRTRSLLCDTETERYRQIGKKSRDGPYGACFFNIPLTNIYYELPQNRGIFRLITDDNGSDNEQLGRDFSDIAIYCARPGIRLWQADCHGDVKLTHQFRSNLIDKQYRQVDLIIIDDCVGEEARLEIKQFPDENFNVDTFSFNRIFNLFNRFILTYNQDGLFIFDPKNSDLLLWSNYYRNIRDVKVINSTIYLWCNELSIAVLSCTIIDDLITKILYKKQYKLCGDLCVRFSNFIEMNLDKSDKLQQLSVLETQLNDRQLLARIQPILDKIQTLPKTIQAIKDKTGIVVINNRYEQNRDQNLTTKSPYDILVEQHKFNRINQNLETSDFLKLIETIDANRIREILQIFSDESQTNEDYDFCQMWCFEIFLKILTKSNNLADLSKSTIDYANEAFFSINDNNENCGCRCGFPLPKSHKFPPKFREIGAKLMAISDDYERFTKTIPYMNRYILETIDNPVDIKLKLPLILQYSDIDIITKIMAKSTYDIWDESIKLLTKLKRNNCLYCSNRIDVDNVLIWKDFLCITVESINAKNTIDLLKSYSISIPNYELNEFFYQFCIFQYSTEIEDSKKLAIFQQTIEKNDEIKKEFEESIGEFLSGKYQGTSTALSTKSSTLLNCDHCTMPLKTPIVDKIVKLSCGHNYHKICYRAIDEKCSICHRL